LGGPGRHPAGAWTPYFVGAGAVTLWASVGFHETPEASWLLGSVPLRRYGQLVLGMVASLVVRQVLPTAAIVVALRMASEPTLVRLAASLHGLFGALLALPILVAGAKDVPYTRALSSREGGRGLARGMASLLLGVLVFAVQAVLERTVPWALFVSAPLFAFALALWLRAVARDLDESPPEALRPAPASALA
jgi:hypothetical protein